MDFFEHQDRARKSTGRLVMLFGAAVVGIILSVYVLVMVLFNYGRAELDSRSGPTAQAPPRVSLWEPLVFLAVAGGTIVVVGFGSLYKVSQLSGGGHVVAEQLGGRRLSTDSSDPVERKVLNVVEEMAIASGTPVPPVFFMDKEMGINAFAAGFSPEDAVVGITRGCAEKLTRDQLQGVVAHEFSHILNGDMRLNIKLIGIVHGILIVGLIGYYVMRTAFYSSAGRSRGSKESNGLPILALGVGLMAIGFIGTLFGNLIKAAVSRQREFLADASAVQFTRNPEGIGGALKVLDGYDKHGELDNPNAPEASHMFFAMGLASGLNSMFATHPPLEERIGRIDRDWAQEKAAMAADSSRGAPGIPDTTAAMGFAGASAEKKGTGPINEAIGTMGSGITSKASPESTVETIGRPTPQHVAHASGLIGQLPGALVDAAREPFSARSIVYAMLLDEDAEVRKPQLERLAVKTESGEYHTTAELFPMVRSLDRKLRLPLIDLAIPALRALSDKQYARFRNRIVELVRADSKIDLFEWVLQKIVLRHLDPHFNDARPPRARYHKLNAVGDPVAVLLSALAYVGARDEAAARSAFDAGAARTGLTGLALIPMDKARLGALGAALDSLAELTPKPRKLLITAAATVVADDGRITASEAELLRAIADTLDCPMPPLLGAA
jgi:Zn-dependent protease with chaperone function/uncharacterized tellurite resistance protein B-like protein